MAEVLIPGPFKLLLMLLDEPQESGQCLRRHGKNIRLTDVRLKTPP
jgi:hypothetical protein